MVRISRIFWKGGGKRKYNLTGSWPATSPKRSDASAATALGYRLEEIQGKHHSVFIADGEAERSDYRNFWQTLAAGEYQAGEFRRRAMDGHDVWIQASYNLILGLDGKPYKVVK